MDNGITLHTHGNGAPIFESVTGPGAEEITITDVGSWTSRRAAHYLIYGQVFDRFPDLTLLITEIEEQWYQTTQWALDSQYRRFGHTPLEKGLPSAYFPANIYMGASFMSPQQATEASRNGYAANVIWGRDYPHMEGAHQAGDFDEPVHLVALRNVMSRVPQQDAVNMAGLNGVRALGLDGEYLATVAARIGAPTVERLDHPGRVLPRGPPALHGLRRPVRPAAGRARGNGDVQARAPVGAPRTESAPTPRPFTHAVPSRG